jgi:hypothetical protein
LLLLLCSAEGAGEVLGGDEERDADDSAGIFGCCGRSLSSLRALATRPELLEKGRARLSSETVGARRDLYKRARLLAAAK